MSGQDAGAFFALQAAQSQEGEKRKREDEPLPPPQGPEGAAKRQRNRYTSLACDECKRRKIKCNGKTKCERCTSMKLDCIYAPNCCKGSFKDSDEYRQMSAQIRDLNEKLSYIYAHFNIPGGPATYPTAPTVPQSDASAPYRDAVSPQTQNNFLQTQAPTGANYNRGLAESGLQTMGMAQSMPEEGGGSNVDPALGAPLFSSKAPVVPSMVTVPQKDPLLGMPLDEMIRLCGVYEQEMEIIFPILDIQKVKQTAKNLHHFIEKGREKNLFRGEDAQALHLRSHEVRVVRIVIALALISESLAQCTIGHEIYKHGREGFDNLLSNPPADHDITLLILLAEYHYQCDQPGDAYQFHTLAASQCLKRGFNDQEQIRAHFKEADLQAWAAHAFWSTVVLDRRWSFHNGKIFAINRVPLNVTLIAEDAKAYPYLLAMLTYSDMLQTGIGVHIYSSFLNSSILSGTIDNYANTISAMDNHIIGWYHSLQPSLRVPDPREAHPTVTRGELRLQGILQLRSMQMQLQIRRVILQSSENVKNHHHPVDTATKIASHMIRQLMEQNFYNHELYCTQRAMLDKFLKSAFAVLFLAVSFAPHHYQHLYQEEWKWTLQLIEGLNPTSTVCQAFASLIEDFDCHDYKPEDEHSEDSSAAKALQELGGVWPMNPTNNQLRGHEISQVLQAQSDGSAAFGGICRLKEESAQILGGMI